MMRGFERSLVARRFARAAEGYDAIAALQREVESRLLEGVDRIVDAPAVVLDAGCGPGRASAFLRKRFKRAQVVSLDIALPMLQQARKRGGWMRPAWPVCADARMLPVPDASVDLVFSSLCLQWLDDASQALAEFARVLRPGGLLLIATFGPDTLMELRRAWSAADNRAHVSDFPPMAALGDALLTQGFVDPVLDRDLFELKYESLDALLGELRAIGANNARNDRARGLTGKSAWRRMREAYETDRDSEGRYPATYEVVYLQALGPQPGRPRRVATGEIATIPVSAIRRR